MPGSSAATGNISEERNRNGKGRQLAATVSRPSPEWVSDCPGTRKLSIAIDHEGKAVTFNRHPCVSWQEGVIKSAAACKTALRLFKNILSYLSASITPLKQKNNNNNNLIFFLGVSYFSRNPALC